MKSGVKGFWKKQKNVICRHRPSTIVSHFSSLYVDLSKIDNGLLDNVHFGSSIGLISNEFENDSKK